MEITDEIHKINMVSGIFLAIAFITSIIVIEYTKQPILNILDLNRIISAFGGLLGFMIYFYYRDERKKLN